MSNLPISSPYRSKPEAPVTEAERDQLSSRLNVAFTEGTLTQEDYQARLDQLFAAQKLGQLVPVVEGLPPMQTYDNPDIITSGGQPGQLAESAPSSHLTLMLVGGLAAVVVLIAILVLLII
ncbi:MAG TPA: DUF1707 domain-containing protein [Propionibacteriaceae bacterium]